LTSPVLVIFPEGWSDQRCSSRYGWYSTSLDLLSGWKQKKNRKL